MASNSELEGRVALITGSTRGIGWATARALAARGATVILNGARDADVLQQRENELRNQGVTACGSLLYDVGIPDAVRDAYVRLHKQFHRLDILVNCAGVMENALLAMQSAESMDRIYRANVMGVLLNLQWASRLMARSGGGAIVNITSILGLRGNAGQVAYCGSKAAVIGITVAAAKELACHKIRVNAVAPGFIETALVADTPPAVRDERIRQIALGRVGQPEEVADAIVFLATEPSRYITGQVIGVDGGMVI